MEFPYGKAPLAILLLALIAGGAVYSFRAVSAQPSTAPDLIFATFTKEHALAYRAALPAFERKHNVRVQLQVVDQRALQGRLQSAFQVGADVPDMVELMDGNMGFFTKGPVEDVGFVDLTEKVRATGLHDKLVANRFGKQSSRGRIFALPHDVHPVMLCYRRDLVEKLGIDVTRLTTWDEFSRVGREVTKDYNGDGVIDHYMIDLPASAEPWALRLLLLQNGVPVFDNAGNVNFDQPAAVDVTCWYARQVQGPTQIAFPCQWGQTLAKSIIDGLCLFYICPDWRTAQFQMDLPPSMSGKLSLIPLPAWKPGGIRTSTWGSTGLAITKQCKNFALAWELAMYLYYDTAQLGPRFADTNILPPYIPSWSQPEFSAPRPYFSNLPLGRIYADLAPQVPDEPSNPYMLIAEQKLWEAYTNIALHHRQHGETGLPAFAATELKRCADHVREVISRNVFLTAAPPPLEGEAPTEPFPVGWAPPTSSVGQTFLSATDGGTPPFVLSAAAGGSR